MKIFGSWSELFSVVFRKNSQAQTVRPNQATTLTASRDLQFPPGDTDHVLVSATSTQTLTNKTLTSPVVNSPTGITKGDVGLGNVDNTSDATKDAATATLTNKTIASPTVTGTLLLQNATGAQPELALSEDPDNGTNKVTIKAPATLAADYTLTLPVDDGTANQVLQTDGSGVLSWATAASSSVATADGVTAGTVKTHVPEVHIANKTVTGADYTILDNDGYQTVYVDCSGSDRTITLPATANNVGRRIRIVKIDTNNSFQVLIARAGSDVIYGGASTTATSVQVEKFQECKELECFASGTWSLMEATQQRVGAMNLDGGFTAGTAYAYRMGNQFFIQIAAPTWTSGSNTRTSTTALIPSGFRPATAAVFACAARNGSHNYDVTWVANTDGTISVKTSDNTATSMDDYSQIAGCYFLRN